MPLRGECFGRRMVGALFAERRIIRAAHCRCEPYPPVAIEHAVVVVGLAVPDLLRSPVGRRLHRLSFRLIVGLAYPGRERESEIRGPVRFRIEDGNNIDANLGGAVNRAIGIDSGVATIRSDQVVQVMLIVEPIPRGDDDVALDSLRPGGLHVRQLALGDAVRPVGVDKRNGSAAEFLDGLVDICSPDCPTGSRRNHASSELANFQRVRHIVRERARGKLAQLMAAGAAVAFHQRLAIGSGLPWPGFFPYRRTR